MSKPKRLKPDKFDELCKRAEEALQKINFDSEDESPDNIRHFIHELHTYQIELEMQNEELRITQEQLNEIKILKGFLPICCHCKKIRDDENCWEDVTDYIREHSEAEFTHCICPECMKKYYPEIMDE